MGSFSATVIVADMQVVNALLEADGFGPGNFSVPFFSPGDGRPTHAAFSAWGDPVFRAAVEALPEVTILDNSSDPVTMTSQLAESVGAQWMQSALPLQGIVTPGLYFDTEGVYWSVIQQYDTAEWPDPLAVPELVVPARMPGEVTVWVQPINAFTAYYLVNPFTAFPDEVEHNGQVWYVNQADGAGLNIWEPGVFGWVVKP